MNKWLCASLSFLFAAACILPSSANASYARADLPPWTNSETPSQATSSAAPEAQLADNARSAVLMDADTGTVIFEKIVTISFHRRVLRKL